MKKSAPTRHPLEVLADELAAEWNATAEILKDHVAVGAARAYRRCAEKLRERVKAYLDEHLDVEEAAEESGYHPAHIGRLIDNQTLPPAEPGRRTVRRRNLPRKPGYGTAAPAAAAESARMTRREIIRRVIEGHKP